MAKDHTIVLDRIDEKLRHISKQLEKLIALLEHADLKV